MGALRGAIAGIERPLLQGPGGSKAALGHPWRLECSELDRLVPQGLEDAAVHEVKGAVRTQGASAGDWMAALGFALRLYALRLRQAQAAHRDGWVLWSWPRVLSGELGRPSARGLLHLGLDPSRLLLVEAAREGDALAAIEEGLRSGLLLGAIGVLPRGIALNPARRLSLAAAAGRVPCLLVTHPCSPGAAGCATRWRVTRQASGLHPFDGKAPGLERFEVALERCQSRPQSISAPAVLVEWCHETLRFHMARQLAHDAPGARAAASCA